MARAGSDFTDGVCLITSRCSYEMVLKSVRMGMPILAAISAPTTLAVELAAATNQTLVALTREQTFTAFTHPYRIAT
jgi:FdhD protein